MYILMHHCICAVFDRCRKFFIPYSNEGSCGVRNLPGLATARPLPARHANTVRESDRKSTGICIIGDF